MRTVIGTRRLECSPSIEVGHDFRIHLSKGSTGTTAHSSILWPSAELRGKCENWMTLTHMTVSGEVVAAEVYVT